MLKSSPGFQRFEVRRNSSRKHAQRVEKPPDTLKFARKLSPRHKGITVHRNSPRKGTQRVQKTPGTLKFARMLSPGHQRVAVQRNNLQKCAHRVGKPPSYSQNRATDFDLRRNRRRGITEICATGYDLLIFLC